MPSLMLSDDDNPAVLTRELVREALITSGAGAEEQVDEYIDEFENWIGDWGNFKTTDEAVEDFRLCIGVLS